MYINIFLYPYETKSSIDWEFVWNKEKTVKKIGNGPEIIIIDCQEPMCKKEIWKLGCNHSIYCKSWSKQNG